MRMLDLIEKKQAGQVLSQEEIQYMVEGFTQGDIPDYQMSAWMMAVFFQGMTEEEAAHLTMAVAQSGDQVDLSAIKGIKVDKHSTGGVGDTTTIILAPLVAAAGVPVAKMSGRGLGHTGGTIDKLEAIEGFHVEIEPDEFIALVNQNNIAVVGQSGNLTPADKKMYALRDVTATVQSIPLIAASIMSKKIAAGADAIVLDVKVGDGAFMKTVEEAETLAQSMVDIGRQVGRETYAVISDMNQPLGNAIGNALEVKEAIDTLKGKGPQDLLNLCLVLGSQMLLAAKQVSTMEEGKARLQAVIDNGRALEVFKTFIQAQGGDPALVDSPEKLAQAPFVIPVKSPQTGYIQEWQAQEVGKIAGRLGAGRMTKEDKIDVSVGIVLHKKIGDYVEKGETLAEIHANRQTVQEAHQALLETVTISSQPVTPPTLIHKIVQQ